VFDDDSPENTKAPVTNTSVARNMDLSRTQEIQSRLNTAIAIKELANDTVGMNRQRLGSPLATETATANQNALVQSFAQTEPWFAAHSYVLNQLYQAMLDAAQYVEGHKPVSTLSYITAAGEAAFMQVQGEDIRLRDLKVFVTSRAEDQQLFNEFRQLAQPMLQNGASIYEVSQLYVTNSLREMQKMFKEQSDKRDGQVAQTQQLEQQKLEQQAQIEQERMKREDQYHEDNLAMEKYKTDVKANTDLAKAEISTHFQMPDTDVDNNGHPRYYGHCQSSAELQDQIDRRDLQNQQLSLEQQNSWLIRNKS